MADELEKKVDEIYKRQEHDLFATKKQIGYKDVVLILAIAFLILWVWSNKILPKEHVFLYATVACFVLFLQYAGTRSVIKMDEAQAIAYRECKRYYERNYSYVPHIQVMQECKLRTEYKEFESGPTLLFWEVPIRTTHHNGRRLELFRIEPMDGRIKGVERRWDGYWGSENYDRKIIREQVLVS